MPTSLRLVPAIVVLLTGAGSYLLEQPLPFLESTHDVIEFKPAG